MSFATLSQNKTKIIGIISCEYSLEHILLGEKKSSFCLGFANKKESSVCLFYSETNLSLNSLTQEKKHWYLEKANGSQAPIKGRMPGESDEHDGVV